MPAKRYFHCEEDESGFEFLERIANAREADKEEGITRDYVAREVRDIDCVDKNGDYVDCRYRLIGRLDLDRMQKDIKNFGVQSPYASRWLSTLENELGIPSFAIKMSYPPKKQIRPLDEISEKLIKYRNRAKYEIKAASAIRKTNEAQNPSTIAGLEILNWLFNDGTSRSPKEITTMLKKLVVMRERDRLFHVIRHRENPLMHVCHDEGLLEKIKIINWTINNYNIFVESATYGHSKF